MRWIDRKIREGKKRKRTGSKEGRKGGSLMSDIQLAMLVPQLLVAACLVALLSGSEVAEQKKVNLFCHKDALS